MKASHLLAAAVVAVAGTSAFAVEATQFIDPPSTLSRVDVKAQLDAARQAGELNARTATYGTFEPKKGSVLSRAEVHREAVAAAHRSFNPLYVGGA